MSSGFRPIRSDSAPSGGMSIERDDAGHCDRDERVNLGEAERLGEIAWQEGEYDVEADVVDHH